MAALRVEAACRVVLGQRLRGVCRLSEVTGRQYHRCSSLFRQHRALAPQTHRLFVFSNVRYQSTGTAAAHQFLDAPPVPEAQFPHSILEAALPPPVSEVAPTVADTVVQAEQSLRELGLGGFSPPGFLQGFLSFLHVDVGLPWWGAVAAATILVRVLIFPLIVNMCKEAVKRKNHMHQITALRIRMNEAKQSGNKYKYSKAYSDLQFYQKKHDVNPLRSFLVPLVQLPIFISFFVALKQMAILPVPSMQTGGLWWFTDLTIADPFYILPVIATCTMWAVIELGVVSEVNNPILRVMKTVFRVMPLILFPITMNFPTAIFTYWITSNLFSIAQVTFLRIPRVREKLKISQQIKHDSSALLENEGFIKTLKTGLLRQTFSQNPLQQKVQTPKKPKPKPKPWQDTTG